MHEGDMTDLQMLLLKKQRYKQENAKDFSDGQVFVQDEFFRFVPQTILNGRVKISLPEDFTQMPEELVRLRYPSEDRPSLVYASRRFTETIAFKVSSHTEKTMEEIAHSVWFALNRFFPQNVYYGKGMLMADGVDVYFIEYKSFAVEGEVYNILFQFAADSKLVTGSFQCEFRDYDEWKKCVFLMLETVCPISNFEEVSQ